MGACCRWCWCWCWCWCWSTAAVAAAAVADVAAAAAGNQHARQQQGRDAFHVATAGAHFGRLFRRSWNSLHIAVPSASLRRVSAINISFLRRHDGPNGPARPDGTCRKRKRPGISRPFLLCTGAGAGLRRLLFLGGLLRLRLQLRPVHQLDQRHRRVVALAEAELEDAQVAAVALGVARAELVEELARRYRGRAGGRTRGAGWRALGVLPSVIIGSTTRRSSFALGSVVLIASWRSSEFVMLRSIARRWLEVRLSLRSPSP